MFGRKRRNKNATHTRNAANQASSSQRVNSYYTASKKQITTFQRHSESSSTAPHRSVKYQIKKYALTIAAIVLIVGALVWMLTLSKTASISIEGGGAYRPATEYQQIIGDALDKAFQNNLKLSLKADTVEKSIKEQLPEAYEVAVYAPLFGRNPEVVITTAKPFATVLQESGPTMVMSDRGRLVQEIAKTNIDATNLPTISNKSGTQLAVADQLFKPEEMAALNSLQFQYTKGGSQAAPVAYILPLAPREIHVQEGAYIAKYSLQQDSSIAQQFGALRAVQSQLQQQGRVPAEYIDIRLASKVFIK